MPLVLVGFQPVPPQVRLRRAGDQTYAPCNERTHIISVGKGHCRIGRQGLVTNGSVTDEIWRCRTHPVLNRLCRPDTGGAVIVRCLYTEPQPTAERAAALT